MDEHPGIGFADGPAGRRAVVLGTGLDVWEVVSGLHASGGSVEAVARYLELPVAPVRAALRYYAAFRAEIDAELARRAAIADREEAAARRERALLR